jgi:hypothetical protein
LAILYFAGKMISGSNNGRDVYVAKVFFTVLMCFVLVPGVIVIKNENIKKHATQALTISKPFKMISSFLTKIKTAFEKFRVDENRVHPDFDAKLQV